MLDLLWAVFVVSIFWFLIGILLTPKDAVEKLRHLPLYKIAIVFCIYFSPLFTALIFAVAFAWMMWDKFSDWLYEER